jgi:hypothetical protein
MHINKGDIMSENQFKEISLDNLDGNIIEMVFRSRLKHEASISLWETFKEENKDRELDIDKDVYPMLGRCIFNDVINDAVVEAIHNLEENGGMETLIAGVSSILPDEEINDHEHDDSVNELTDEEYICKAQDCSNVVNDNIQFCLECRLAHEEYLEER